MDLHKDSGDKGGLSLAALSLRSEVASGQGPSLTTFAVGDCTADVHVGRDSLWLLVRRPGAGGFACRLAYAPGAPPRVETVESGDGTHEFQVFGAPGAFRVRVAVPDPARPLLRWTTRLTPAADLLISEWPRDLFPLDAQGDPCATAGAVHASQRGVNSGVLYLTLAEPRFGSLLYFQNWTALNDFFAATGTTPDGRVSGLWPELGYQLPSSAEKPLPQGKEVTLADAFVHLSPQVPEDERQSAGLFLDLLAGIYAHLDWPQSQFHDWPRRAEETLRDLQEAPDATVTEYGHRYLHPYTGDEYPDSMVQLAVLYPIREYAAWAGRPAPFTDELRAGVAKFFDPKLSTVRRYLPSVNTEDKNPDQVDSWYLYHPMMNLARLARDGDSEAGDLLLKSLEYGIKVARHFEYRWPVFYDMNTLEVLQGPRKPNEPGQSDVGAFYAYVCLQAYDLTGDDRYLEEAKAGVRALEGLNFNIEYQANTTAWGAGACLRLWKITGDAFYRDQGHVLLASFFHNALIWESEIGAAEHYPTFLGACCLNDGPYMAMYECFESYAAFHEYLTWAEGDLPPAVQLLLTEFCKYTPSRAWYYYPRELPEDAISPEPRNGRNDRALAFPLEDLYGDGQPAGQVGQEIYGCGAAFAFTTRSYHRLKDAPFVLFCEYPLFALEQTDEPCLSFQVRGVDGFSCRARLIPNAGQTLPPVVVRTGAGDEAVCVATPEGHREFTIPAGAPVEIRWERRREDTDA